MKFLLDVNALLAWRHQRSPHHASFHSWIATIGTKEVATCAITELGFLRVSMTTFGYSLIEAQRALAAMKRTAGGFIEQCPAPVLPQGTSAGKSTDAYLAQLAASAGLSLATFDRGISGATLIT